MSATRQREGTRWRQRRSGWRAQATHLSCRHRTRAGRYGRGCHRGRHHLVTGSAGLAVSLGLQVGVNYASDHSDGVRGTDAARVGPFRLVGSGAAGPSAVKVAALAAFAVAAALGLVLAAATSWWLVAVGAASIAAAWLYTGGPRPSGYAGLGEVFVFVFFGLVAVCGTTFGSFDA